MQNPFISPSQLVKLRRHPLWNINFSACPRPFIPVCKVNLNFSFLDGIHSSRPLLPEEAGSATKCRKSATSDYSKQESDNFCNF